MNINASIVDQRIAGIVEDHLEWLPEGQQVLFDPARDVALNPKIRPKVEEIRSLVRDGYIPDVRVVLCNNGDKWKDDARHWIDQSGLPHLISRRCISRLLSRLSVH